MRNSDNVLDCLEFWAKEQPSHTAIMDAACRVTYGELWDQTKMVAAAFGELGIKKGDFVITLVPNCYELILTFLALTYIGAVFTPCSANSQETEIVDRLHSTPPVAVIVSEDEQFEIVARHQHNYLIISLNSEKAGDKAFKELLSPAVGARSHPVELDIYNDPSLAVFTSGSTGTPKGVLLPAISIFKSAINIKDRLEADNTDIFAMPLPLCHMFGIVVGMLTPLYAGGTILTFKKFNVGKALDCIEEYKATIVYGVPTMFSREIAEQEKNPRDLSSVKIGMVAGAFSNPSLLSQAKSVLGFDLMIGYGMSEMVTISMSKTSDSVDKRMTSVGQPYPGVEVKISDDAGNTLGTNATGEILSRGYGLMLGYHNNPEETAKAIDSEGWMHTGDLGYLDEDGYLHICGRKKELILRGGQNIFPAEIEKLYYQNPAVEEISVVSIPHEDLGEQTVACVVLQKGVTETGTSLRDFAKGKIIKYKIPDHVLIMDHIPKLLNGKIDKPTLRKQVNSTFSL